MVLGVCGCWVSLIESFIKPCLGLGTPVLIIPVIPVRNLVIILSRLSLRVWSAVTTNVGCVPIWIVLLLALGVLELFRIWARMNILLIIKVWSCTICSISWNFGICPLRLTVLWWMTNIYFLITSWGSICRIWLLCWFLNVSAIGWGCSQLSPGL